MTSRTSIDAPLDISVVTHALTKQIAFHHKWKTLTMFSYAISSVGIVIGSSAAMLFAALNHGTIAAIFAAISGILASAEKSLLLREKWKIHLSIMIALQNLEIDIAAGIVDVKQALDEIKRVGQSYAKDLPVESRVG